MKRKSDRSGPRARSTEATTTLKLLTTVCFPTDSTSEVKERLKYRSASVRRKCLNLASFALTSDQLRKDEQVWVSSAKLLAASLPESLAAISKLLRRRNGRYSYEVHFSLLVFLADVDDLHLPDGMKEQVINLISDYLYAVRVSTARAAWMAGHALGEHITDSVVGDLLAHLATSAKYAHGREAALQGLSEWLEQRKTRPPRYAALLKRTATMDRSERVRAMARVVMRRIRRTAPGGTVTAARQNQIIPR